MNLELSNDQAVFHETTRRFLESDVPLTKVRALYDDPNGYEPSMWSQAAGLGWTSLFVPEAHGGGSLSGSPTRDAVILAEEIGRLVAPGPFVPVNVVALAIATAASREVQAAVLPGIVAGTTVAAWAFAERGSVWDPDRFAVTATPAGDGVVVSGTKSYVEAAGCAHHFLVTARSADGLTQVLIPRDSAGLRVANTRSVDMTRRFGTVMLDDVEVPGSAIVGDIGGAADLVERQLTLALALQCAELVGIADRVLQLTMDYGRERYAFGRPIMSFQALKHRIADMTGWTEGAKAVSDELAAAIDDRGHDAMRLAHVAKAYVGDRCPRIVDECVQIIGGIGVTWEHDIHLYNRRAVLDRAVYGTPEQHKSRLADVLGI